MLSTNSPSRVPAPVAFMAEWPPEDSDLPNLPPAAGAGGGGEFDPSKQRSGGMVALIVLVVALLLGGGIVAAVLMLPKTEAELQVDEAMKIQRGIFTMPKDQALAEWRKWAASNRSNELKEQALKQLAYAKDPEGVRLAVEGLGHVETRIVAMSAMCLAWYGSPMADAAKPHLLEVMKAADDSTAPQIAWALVELKEPSAFEDVMRLYRAGHLSKVLRIDGSPAFDPAKLVAMIGIDRLVTLVDDPNGAVRQLVATELSRLGDPKYVDALIKLVQDESAVISAQAAPGLGKVGDARALEPLVSALKKADKDERNDYLNALRDGQGTEGLVLALRAVDEDERSAWFQTQRIFDMIVGDDGKPGLNDPRGGDALHEYINSRPHIYWQTRAAVALANIGDLRAVPVLAKRLRMDTQSIYQDEHDYILALKRQNPEKRIASRMIADLAILHPDQVDAIREQAEDALVVYLNDELRPHANAMRALAAMGSTAHLDSLRKWAKPDAQLPREGQTGQLPMEWEIAQSALRYLGWMKHEPSWGVLTGALTLREPELDCTKAAMMQGGVTMLCITLRGLAYGAAQGMAQWQRPEAFDLLLKYIEDPRNNEEGRDEACKALAWVAEPDDMVKVAEKIQEYDEENTPHQYIRGCLLQTLITRPVPGTAPALVKLMKGTNPPMLNILLARAIGKAGLTPEVEQELFGYLSSDDVVTQAVTALILGGTPETAARAVASLADKPEASAKIAEVKDQWWRAFGYWSHEDLMRGRIFHWLTNAKAIARVEIDGKPQLWAAERLARHLNTLAFDNGPHSFTRVVLRMRLRDMVLGDDPENRKAALDTLEFMKEQGVILALRDQPGEVGQMAAEAYHRLLFPGAGSGEELPQLEQQED